MEGEYIHPSSDLLHDLHNPLESSVVRGVAVPVPDGDAAGQDTLNGAPVEGCKDGWREVHLLQPLEEVQ